MNAVSSPCVRICVIEPASGLCEGCARTLDEIARWGGMTEAQRLAVMAELPERQNRLAQGDKPNGPTD